MSDTTWDDLDGLDDLVFPDMRDDSPLCQCDEQPTPEQMDFNVCSCCGKAFA